MNNVEVRPAQLTLPLTADNSMAGLNPYQAKIIELLDRRIQKEMPSLRKIRWEDKGGIILIKYLNLEKQYFLNEDIYVKQLFRGNHPFYILRTTVEMMEKTGSGCHPRTVCADMPIESFAKKYNISEDEKPEAILALRNFTKLSRAELQSLEAFRRTKD